MRKQFALIAALSLASFGLMAQTTTPGTGSAQPGQSTNPSGQNGTGTGTNNGATGAGSSSTPK